MQTPLKPATPHEQSGPNPYPNGRKPLNGRDPDETIPEEIDEEPDDDELDEELRDELA